MICQTRYRKQELRSAVATHCEPLEQTISYDDLQHIADRYTGTCLSRRQLYL